MPRGALGWGVPRGAFWGCSERALPRQAPGPLLVLLPVRGPTEAVALASALPHAAAAAVWAQDITVALDTADR